MSDIWLISDTHFNHSNILTFRDGDDKLIRPGFKDVEHMNELMIENWNSTVKPGDKIYHLGDVFFGSKEWFKANWPRLNGRKRLIVGNHDDVKFLSCGAFFEKVQLWRVFKDFNMVLSHVPIDPSSFGKVEYNVHGHIHEKAPPTDHHVNVSVEMINYIPVHIEDVLST